MHGCLAQMDPCHPHRKTHTSRAAVLEMLTGSPGGALHQDRDARPHLLLSAGKCWDAAAGELTTSSSNPACSNPACSNPACSSPTRSLLAPTLLAPTLLVSCLLKHCSLPAWSSSWTAAAGSCCCGTKPWQSSGNIGLRAHHRSGMGESPFCMHWGVGGSNVLRMGSWDLPCVGSDRLMEPACRGMAATLQEQWQGWSRHGPCHGCQLIPKVSLAFGNFSPHHLFLLSLGWS